MRQKPDFQRGYEAGVEDGKEIGARETLESLRKWVIATHNSGNPGLEIDRRLAAMQDAEKEGE